MCFFRIAVLLLLPLLSFVWTIPAKAETHYRLVDLGSMSDGESVAYGINNNGQVVGKASDRAVIWEDGVMTILTDYGYRSTVFAINNASQAVGTIITVGSDPMAVIFEDGSWSRLFSSDGNAYGINDNQVVIGWLQNNSQAVMKDLVSGIVTNISFSVAPKGINDLNHIVAGGVLWDDGVFTQLGNLGLNSHGSTTAYDINNNDIVVGMSCYEPGNFHAFRWDNVNGIVDLGTIGGTYSGASAVNEIGEIVGSSWNSSTSWHAVVWDTDGLIHDLNSLADVTGWIYLSDANDINDKGQIVGVGYKEGGVQHAYLLSPIGVSVQPENHDFAICSIGCQKSVTLTVVNEHIEAADIISIGVTTGDAAFSIENDLCSGQSLQSMASCTFDVLFTPQTAGLKTGDVDIAVRDYYLRSLKVEVSGGAERCEGDFDRDGDKDTVDILLFAADFGKNGCSGDCAGDFLNDGDVDGADMTMFLGYLESLTCQGCD